MKKHYFLALMASVVCGMSVQAQQVTSQSGPQLGIQIQAESLSNPTLVQNPVSLLRSAGTNQIDSVIRTDGNGAKMYKYLYAYTENGQVASIEGYKWDVSTSNWANEKYYSYVYTYDENGKRIRTVYETINDGQASTETTTNIYDTQGRLTDTYTVSDEMHSSESYFYREDGTCNYMSIDSTFTEGVYARRTIGMQERTLNEAGDVTKIIYLGFDEWKGDETMWIQRGEENITYDSLNRMHSSHYFWMDGDVITYTRDITYAYTGDDDLNYTAEQITTDNGQTTYYAVKYEMTEGNPRVQTVSYKNAEGDAWSISYRDTYYFPQGSSVANESIQPNAASICKVWTSNGALTVATSEVVPVQVYSIQGVCRYHAKVAGEQTIPLSTGIYIVKCQQETYKFVVK